MKKGFFCETWKGLIALVYIISPVFVLLQISGKHDIDYILNTPHKGYAIFYTALIFNIVNFVCYLLNYRYLLKKGTIRAHTGRFFIGFAPVFVAAVSAIWLWITLIT